jgi:hypothetical protein
MGYHLASIFTPTSWHSRNYCWWAQTLGFAHQAQASHVLSNSELEKPWGCQQCLPLDEVLASDQTSPVSLWILPDPEQWVYFYLVT